tara:strand:- start:67 stop:312 length:246 start_codon:yes stop_codon:yes gene_type:complete
MKAVLEYDLNNPDDRKAHMRAVKSDDMYFVLFQITSNLRRRLEHKFESQGYIEDEIDELEEVFIEIDKLMNDYKITIEIMD